MINISIIMPCRNEEKYIEAAIDSIVKSRVDKSKTEFICVDGESSDKTKEIIQNKCKDHSFIKLLNNSNKTVPYALNKGIRVAKGEYIFRIDAHSTYPLDYFTRIINWHEKLNADNVGGICITEVVNKNKKSMAIKIVLSDRLGVGNSLFRIGTETVKEVDTVPFGCYRKDVFYKYGLFDTRLIRNQDIEFNKRIKKKGGNVYLVPDVYCTYFVRETYSELAKNNFANGFWNILTAFYTKYINSLSIRHFIPFLFVTSLVISGVSAIFIPVVGLFAVFCLLLYFSSIVIRSIQINSGETTVLHLVCAFTVLHFSYGIGSVMGLAKSFWLSITNKGRNK